MFIKFFINSIKNYPVRYIVTVLCEIFLLLIVFCANGILLDTFAKSNQEYNNAKYFDISLLGQVLNIDDINIDDVALNISDTDDKAVIDGFRNEISDIQDINHMMLLCPGDMENYYTMTPSIYAFDNYKSMRDFFCNVFGMKESEIPTKQQYDNHEKVVIGGEKVQDFALGPDDYRYVDDNHILVGTENTVCAVSGFSSSVGGLAFIYGCQPENMKVTYISVQLTNVPTDIQVKEIKEVIKKYFGTEVSLYIPETGNLLDMRKNTANIVLTLLLLMMVVFNIIIFFRQMIGRHKREFAVFGLCGFTKATAVYYSLGEMILTSLFSFVCGSLVFDMSIKPILTKSFGSVTTMFSFGYYIFLILIFIILSALMFMLCIAPILKKSVIRQFADI